MKQGSSHDDPSLQGKDGDRDGGDNSDSRIRPTPPAPAPPPTSTPTQQPQTMDLTDKMKPPRPPGSNPMAKLGENSTSATSTDGPINIDIETGVEPDSTTKETIDGNVGSNGQKPRRRQYKLEKSLTDRTVHAKNTSKGRSDFDFFFQDPSAVPPIPSLDLGSSSNGHEEPHPLKRPSPTKQQPAERQHHDNEHKRDGGRMSQEEQNDSNNVRRGSSVDESPFVQPLLQLFEDPHASNKTTESSFRSVDRNKDKSNSDEVDDPYDDDQHEKMGAIIQFPNPQPSRKFPPDRSVSFEPDPHDGSSVGSSLGDPLQHMDDDIHTTDGEDNEVSQKSLDSHVFRTATFAIPELSMSERERVKKSVRAAGRTVHHSDRMVSLTVDMETGRAGTRGQHAMMRGTSFGEAQSPRLRRRRGWSNNLRKVRRKITKRLRNRSNATGGGGGTSPATGAQFDRHGPMGDDDDDDDSAISDPAEKSRGVHGRLVVKQRSVMVDDEPVQNQVTGKIETSLTQHEEKQYRLSAMTTTSLRRRGRNHSEGGRTFLQNWQSSLYEETATHDNGGLRCCCIRPNQLVHRYLFWAFRNSFALVFLSAAALFYFLTTFFALILYVLGAAQPTCIHVNGEDFGLSEDPFMDAYALSWTSFTTVGYGLVFPSTSATTMNARECMVVSIVATLEAFVGILFSSFWGAIFFSKITRVSSHAQVTFSDAIIVKYGSGVSELPEGHDDDDDKSSEEEPESFLFPSAANMALNNDTVNSAPGFSFSNNHHNPPFSRPFRYKTSKLPCPFLEFRVMNNLYNQRGGEIIDATMNIVASMDENQAALAVRKAARGSNQNAVSANQRRRRRRRGKLRPVVGSGGIYNEDIDEDGVDLTDEGSIKKLQESVRSMVVAHNKAWALDLDPSGKFLPKRIFCKLDVESQEHPFFKRIWQVRHILDHNSPLLKQEAKEMVRLNGGHWPVELNNAEAVRASIHFDQILVSLSGTSNVDANPVYAQKVYDHVDMCVGYSFCNMLFRDHNGCIQVDPNLLNDVNEQTGGGGEELEMDTQKNQEVFIL